MAFKAKFEVTSIEQKPNKFSEVQLRAVAYDRKTGNESNDNKHWSKSTPFGRILLVITNPDAFDEFYGLGEYIVTFEKVD